MGFYSISASGDSLNVPQVPLPWMGVICGSASNIFCKGILGLGLEAKEEEEAGRAASSPWAPQPGGAHRWCFGGKKQPEMFLPVDF